jgi:diguanylate cyclase (GGDEF)-like protein
MHLFLHRLTLILLHPQLLFRLARRLGKPLLLALGWLAVAGLASASHVQQDAGQGTNRQSAGQVLIDASGQQTLHDIGQRFERGEATQAQPDRIMPTGGAVAVWYRLSLPAVTVPTSRVLAVPHPGMNRVELYRPGETGTWHAEYSGDAIAVDRWPLRYLHPVFEFVQQPGEVQATYLRLQHSHPINVHWTLWSTRDFQESSKHWHLLLGAYAGLVALVILLCLVNAWNWRDSIHSWYAAYVAMIAAGQLSLTGLAGEYFWPHNPWWNDVASGVLPLAGAALGHLFMRELVVERGARWATHLMLALAAAGAALAGGLIFFGRDPFFAVTGPYYIASCGVYLGVALWYAWRIPRVGLWLMAGMLAMLAGAFLPILRNMQLIPMSFWTQHGAQIGAAVQIPLLLIALYLRSRERRDNQARVGALSRVDPLTGAANHRVMLARLEHLLHHQQRDPEAGVVLRVRIGNIQEIRAEYGLQVAQTALVHAGACITHVIREGDTVARHRDGDFVVILEGRLERDKVAEMGQRLIARGLAPSDILPPGAVLQLKVAVAARPFHPEGVALLLQTLEAAVSELAARPGKALRFVV